MEMTPRESDAQPVQRVLVKMLGPESESTVFTPRVTFIDDDARPGGDGSRITVKQLAEAMEMDRSACRKYVLRLGYKPKQMRTADSGFQTAGTLSTKEARAVWASRRADGYVQGDAPF